MVPDLAPPMLADRGLPRGDLTGRIGARPTCTALWIDGEPLLDRPYLERRQRLEELRLTGSCGVLPHFPGPDAAEERRTLALALKGDAKSRNLDLVHLHLPAASASTAPKAPQIVRKRTTSA